MAALSFAPKRWKDEAGQTMAEYAVVLAVVTLLVVGAITVLSVDIGARVSRVANYINF